MRPSSAKNASSETTLRSAKPHVTPSAAPSATGIRSTSASTSADAAPARSSIPWEKSNPTTR